MAVLGGGAALATQGASGARTQRTQWAWGMELTRPLGARVPCRVHGHISGYGRRDLRFHSVFLAAVWGAGMGEVGEQSCLGKGGPDLPAGIAGKPWLTLLPHLSIGTAQSWSGRAEEWAGCGCRALWCLVLHLDGERPG